MHGLDQHGHVVGRRGRNDSVAEIEDMAGCRAGCVHHGGGFARDGSRIGQKHERIEIPLQSHPRADAPPRFGTIGNASYTLQVGAYTAGSSPFSIRIERGVTELGAIEIGDFLGVPRPIDPPEGGVASGRRLEFAPDGIDREPTFHMHLLSTMDGQPVWRGVTCGGLHAIELADLSGAGYAWPPTGEQLVWTMWSVDVAGGDYAQWTYRWLGASYWTGYAADAVYASFPTP